jgi:hypothetical protein
MSYTSKFSTPDREVRVHHSIEEAEAAGGAAAGMTVRVSPAAKPVACRCGYQADSAADLDEHVLASMRLDGDHGEG